MAQVNNYPTKLPLIPQKQHFSLYEAARLSGVSPILLTEWEGVFTQLPRKTAEKSRYYTKDDILLVRKICWLLYNNGYTMAQIQQYLADDGYNHGVDHNQCAAGCTESHQHQPVVDKSSDMFNVLLADLKQLESDLTE